MTLVLNDDCDFSFQTVIVALVFQMVIVTLVFQMVIVTLVLKQ